MIYRFADCELDTARFELRRGGAAQKVEPQVFEILRFLVERHGEFVGKEELHEAIWQRRVVSDATISSRIKAARRAIGDDGTGQRLIRTVHGRGFSFVAPLVREESRTHLVRGLTEAAAQATRDSALLCADVHLNDLLNGDGPASMADSLLLSERARLKPEIEICGGRALVSPHGGVTAVFDAARNAVACAASLQARGQRAGWRATTGAPPAVRVGICESGDDGAQTAAIAGRLQCMAGPGEICVTGRIEESAGPTYGSAGKPLAAGPAEDSNEARLWIVPTSGAPTAPERPGIPQLQCGPPARPSEPSVVILPFQALGGGEHATELAEGLRIDIQNALTKISRILLIAAASGNAFRGTSPESAAHALGVRYVLHGAVQVVKERARASIELIDTLSMHAVWTEQFDIGLSDAFTVQDEITRKVIAALDVKLYSGEQARIWHQSLTDPGVVRVFYRGVRSFFRMDCEAMADARRSFESVAEMRPESSIGATWTALCHWIDYVRRWREPRAESLRQARHWAEAAAGLPDIDGQAHTVLAHVRLLEREFDAALAAGRKALEVRPGCANANGFFGNVLHYCGHQELAIDHLRRAIRLQPVYPPFFAGVLATAYLTAGQVESAAAVAKEALRLNRRDIPARLLLVAASQVAGSPRLANLFVAEILQLDAAFSVGAYRGDQPYRDPGTLDDMAAAWLAAGLPS